MPLGGKQPNTGSTLKTLASAEQTDDENKLKSTHIKGIIARNPQNELSLIKGISIYN